MVFEFVPTIQEVVESLWRFSIPSLSQTFLLVGHTTEPAVLLDRAYINFHSINLGSTSKETVYLVNNEPTEHSFEFLKKSCYSSGHTARVKVNPIQGTVKPHSRYVWIRCTFSYMLYMCATLNTGCLLRSPSQPVSLKSLTSIWSVVWSGSQACYTSTWKLEATVSGWASHSQAPMERNLKCQYSPKLTGLSALDGCAYENNIFSECCATAAYIYLLLYL